jgi:hypothetical protein
MKKTDDLYELSVLKMILSIIKKPPQPRIELGSPA